MRLKPYILLIGLLACFLTVEAQVTPIQKSKNKIVVGGKTYLLHIVAPKQTLYSICKAYGVDMAKVMTINNKKSTALNVNDALRIPIAENMEKKAPKYSGDFVLHTVEKGETLFALYRKYGVPIADIIQNNPSAEKVLSIGDVLKIPKLQKQEEKQQLPQPHFDRKYYYYIVQPGDTPYSIARKFGIRYRKMRRHNRYIKKRDIRPGDEMRILLRYVEDSYLEKAVEFEEKEKRKQDSVKQAERDRLKAKLDDFLNRKNKEKPEEEQKPTEPIIVNDKEIEVALLLPLYLQANDTINQIVTVEDSTTVVTERNPRIMYRKTKNFLRFYQGVLTAVDTLSKQGYRVKLSLYDTQNNPQTVRKILSQMQAVPFDFILGPIYPGTFSAATQFAKIHQIPIISPLSVKNITMDNNPFAVQLNSSIEAVSRNLANYVTSQTEATNIVVLHSNNYDKTEEYNLVKDIEKQLFGEGKYWNANQMNYQKINYDVDGLNGLANVLREGVENIVVIPSNDQPLVEHYITELNILKNRFNIRVVGFPKWQRFNSLELNLFYDLNLTLLTPYYIDYKKTEIENFTVNFRNQFGCEPNDFSFRGYDAMLFFSKLAGRYGKTFLSRLNTIPTNFLQSDYRFEKVGENGGYENQGLFYINYNKDYFIQHRKMK